MNVTPTPGTEMGINAFHRVISSISIAALVASSPLVAQARYDAPDVRVEVLGLERWSLRMLQDSVAHHVPGQKLHDAACMATLRYKLLFRDAQVTTYTGYSGPDSKQAFLSIRVVEPGNTTAVRWRKLPSDDFQSLLPDYAKLIIPITDSTGGIWLGRVMYSLQFRDSASLETSLGRMPAAAREDANHLRKFLAEHRTDADRLRATKALDSNSFYANRITAAIVLSSFPEHDATWHTLVRALRDPHETVRGAASTALSRMPPRTIDWSPVSQDLRYLLGGTNLGAMEQVMSMLAESSVDPKLARTLLRGNDQWVMRLLTSEAPSASARTKALLKVLNAGKDLGSVPAPWKAWIAQL